MPGICASGCYVPRYRLNRGLIYKATGWLNAGNIGNAKGEKAVANHDEDSVTMAVAAARNALQTVNGLNVNGVYFASTTMPYKERLNAGIITTAVGLPDQVIAADFGGGLKAGTTAMLSALDGIKAGSVDNLLVCAAECRLGKPSSPQELIFGDAAAAFVLGTDDVIAEFKGSYSLTCDFGDHYRGAQAVFDRQWEDRWIRDVGVEKFIPEVINGLLEKYEIQLSDFAKVIYDCQYAAARKSLNKKLGITPEMEQTHYQAQIGQSGTAQSLLMLAGALEEANPGDKILVVSFGSGCDALYFEVTDNIRKMADNKPVTAALANRAELDNYTKYLTWRGILPMELGLRAEEDLWTRYSAYWRVRKTVLGLYGTQCKACGTPQFPLHRICVNPECGEVDQMAPYRFADRPGKVASYTGDMLAASYNPPAIYGQIIFEGGGKYMFDLTDCDLDELETGMPVRMSFRRRYHDKKRGISGYFWKAVPFREVK
ncbi:MAG: 3-hydroxy-3-methylglutaryl CoA synthase [Desulfatitalea sp.]|nr:OB-fold domain-containing protein [Desulfatitalea sp.]NNK00384.1 3-hydroxy-3-methylglutaryl CoA synthase [Desulfatitalea sp.]